MGFFPNDANVTDTRKFGRLYGVVEFCCDFAHSLFYPENSTIS